MDYLHLPRIARRIKCFRYRTRGESGSISAGLIILIVVVGATLYFTNFFTIRQYPETGPRGVIKEVTTNRTNALTIADLKIQAVSTAPTAAPEGQPVPTSPPVPETVCLDAAAVVMMLDRSQSMNTADRIENLREAVKSFVANFSDETLVSIQSFNSTDSGVPRISEHISLSRYGEVKDRIPRTLDELNVDGGTPILSALKFSLDKLTSYVSNNPNKNFAYIFVTDGDPNPNDDPSDSSSPDYEGDIKQLGVTSYSIGISINSGSTAQRVLQTIASSSNHVYLSPTGDDLTQIYNQIAQQICS